MGFRYRKSIKLAPGVRMNLSKRGAGFSLGPRGASVSVGSRGAYANVGIPGTGVSYRTKLSGGSSQGRGATGETGALEVKLVLHDDGKVEFRGANDVPLPARQVKLVRENASSAIDDWLREQCDIINYPVESRVRIHQKTPAPNSRLKYIREEFDTPHTAPPEERVAGLRGRLSRSYRERIEEENRQRHREYRRAVKVWEAEREAFEATQEENRTRFEELRLTNVDVMDQFLSEALGALDWPGETNVNYDIADEAETIYLDVDLPEIEDFPHRTAKVAARGVRLNIKDISETQTRRNYAIHVHGIGFRLIGEVFAILPSARLVVLSVYSQRSNKATGVIEDEYLYSVKADRGIWAKIDFRGLDRVDPIEALGLFEIRRNVTKTGIIKTIEPFGPA